MFRIPNPCVTPPPPGGPKSWQGVRVYGRLTYLSGLCMRGRLHLQPTGFERRRLTGPRKTSCHLTRCHLAHRQADLPRVDQCGCRLLTHPRLTRRLDAKRPGYAEGNRRGQRWPHPLGGGGLECRSGCRSVDLQDSEWLLGFLLACTPKAQH